MWWVKNISKNKTRIGLTMVESALCYGRYEVWTIRKKKSKMMAVEMDYLTRSVRILKLERVRCKEIRNIIMSTETVVHRIEIRVRKWFGMEDTI